MAGTNTSVFDLFRVGVGPSSSHTVGPMRAAAAFVERVKSAALLWDVVSMRVELFGSLGATGRGHGSVEALVAGLSGEQPETVAPAAIAQAAASARSTGAIRLGGVHPIAFSIDNDVVLDGKTRLPFHSNGMSFRAAAVGGRELLRHRFYSVGGGVVVAEDEIGEPSDAAGASVPYPFTTAGELLATADASGQSIGSVMLANELTWRTEAQVRSGLLNIWSAMQDCVRSGLSASGVLPGSLRVRRRAAMLHERLISESADGDPLRAMDWVTLFAIAVNEENAAGGRVVTAPTNGAAGIIPAVLHYLAHFTGHHSDHDVVDFLLTAGAVGTLIKRNSSISGAQVGCQGEVGSACAMAAAGLAAVLGGTPEQVENAAEIGIEHNLGLTCDPVGGLVQIPCIERNGVAAVKAITAARIAIRGDGQHFVSLDTAIETMRATGADMLDKYKETSRGGLAVAIVEC
jgi:L-serine dehydratase